LVKKNNELCFPKVMTKWPIQGVGGKWRNKINLGGKKSGVVGRCCLDSKTMGSVGVDKVRQKHIEEGETGPLPAKTVSRGGQSTIIAQGKGGSCPQKQRNQKKKTTNTGEEKIESVGVGKNIKKKRESLGLVGRPRIPVWCKGSFVPSKRRKSVRDAHCRPS